jgi:hypothetical protein
MFRQTIAALAVFLCGAWLLLAARNRDDARDNNSWAIQATQLPLTEFPVGERRAVSGCF